MKKLFAFLQKSTIYIVLCTFISTIIAPLWHVNASSFSSSNYVNIQTLNQNVDIKMELEKDYCIRWEKNTQYWKVYLLSKKSGSCDIQERASFWDVTDIAMAWISWAQFFNDNSWKNFGWAILDTVSLLPLIPSLSYVRNSDEAIKLIVSSYLQWGKYRQWIMNAFTYKIGDFRFNRTAALHMYEKARYVPVAFIEQVIRVGKQVPDKRMPGFIAYYVNNLYVNGKRYNFKVVYNPTTNIIQHFHFQREAIDGILPAIKDR